MNHKGFTMIELVIIIVIIGILAAMALPRFANLSSKSYVAANQNAAAQFRAAVNITHIAWIAAGAPTTINTVTVESWGATLNGRGWRNVGGNLFSSSGNGGDGGWCVLNIGYLYNFPQTVSNNGASCTEPLCYVATAANSLCTYTLNGTSVGFTYNVANGNVATF